MAADEPKPACDDVSTGMQDSHEIWEEGREGIEIAKVAREHGLDVPTARIVQQKLEQERRKSAGLRTLSANSQIMSGFEAVTALLNEQQDKFAVLLREEREQSKPQAAIDAPRLAALQTRLQALHVAQLLSDDELYALEDTVADFVELEAAAGTVITQGAIHSTPGDAYASAAKLVKLVALSERIVADSAFARQARRKYV
jgi:hypothetical protein